MAAAYKIGIKAFLSLDGSTNAASVLDAALNVDWDEGDAGSRASRIKLMAKTMAALEVTAKVKVCDGADYATLYAATWSDTVLPVTVLDGPITEVGSQGVKAGFQVFSKKQDQAANGTIYDEFVLKPAPGTVVPQTAVVGSGGTLSYVNI